MKSLHISVAPEVITHFGPFKITNSLLTSLIVMLFLVIIAFKVKDGSSKKKKSVLYLAVDLIIEKFYAFFKNIAGERTDTIFPLLITFFLFIIFGNWIGLLPGVGSIGFYEAGGE